MADEQAEDRGGDAPHDHSDANSQQKAGSEDGSEEKNGEKKPSLLERFPIIRYVLIAALVAGILAAVVWYLNYRASGQYLQSTNNAYVRADFVTVSPKVGGYVERVLV
ncbi:MAG: multidrug ABC transporter permease, partial [Caulobacter sp. 12-67-6]